MTFATACQHYAQAGWPCIIPVPPHTKHPPPGGFTGADGRDTAPGDLEFWAGQNPDYSIALRMPDGVIGIDVDHYTKGSVVKTGADQLAEKIAQWGELPPTWSSTSRGSGNGDGPGLSRIMFFRVPARRYVTKLGPDIEVIQRHHRYAVVAPSVHPDISATYTWYDPEGHQSARMPSPAELAELPQSWVDGMAEGATEQGPAAAGSADGQALLSQLLADDRAACVDTRNAEEDAARLLSGALPGSRHDTMTERVYHLVLLGAEGHPGTGPALARLGQHWDELTAGENRGHEYTGMMATAARKAVTSIGATTMRAYDPCLTEFGVAWTAPQPDAPVGGPAPEGGPEAAPGGGEPPRIVSIREYIGAEPFDPNGALDHTLAQRVLERMWPALRYAADADTWLLRGPWVWTTPPGDLSQWAVTELTWLMPRGDPTADKDTQDGQQAIAQAARRKRFGTTAGANAISRKMRTHVLAGTHPSSVELATLDSEPEILWAGGLPWDLRASAVQPARADIDPGTPHLHSAGVTPERRPTPLWDAYTRAVWPDPELRAWALRVLSIAFTGYPDKTLPILRGDTDRGKTQVIMLLMNVLGTYGHVANSKLLSGADRSHDSIVMALKGRRLSFIDEAPRSGHQAQERLKQLTGGSALTGNFMQKNPVTFEPTHTLILTANPEAEPPLTDPAVRRRARLIPCTGDPSEVIAARAAVGPVNQAAWRNEAPGVLAAMMAEAAAWLGAPASAYSTAAPLSAQAVTDEIAAGQDTVRSWLENETEPWNEGTRSRPLYQEFVVSCRQSNIPATAIPSETLWGRRLTELGYPSEKIHGSWHRKLRTRRLGFDGSFGAGPPVVPVSAEVSRHSQNVAGLPGRSADVAGSGGLAGKPAKEEKPSSDATSTTVSGGLAGSEPVFIQEEITPPIYIQGNRRQPANPPADTPETAADLRKEAPGGSLADPPALEQPATEPGNATEGDENQLFAGDGTSLAETVGASDRTENTESDETPVSPPKQKKRQRASAKPKPPKRVGPDPELAGPVFTLPAAVNRAGDVVSCTLEQAMALAASDELTVDVETTGYPIGHPDYALRTVQLGDENLAVVFDATDPAQLSAVSRVMSGARVLHAHSAVADLVPLEQAGVVTEEAWHRMDDTVLRAKLADPQLSGSDADGLKQLAADVVPGAVIPAANEARKKLFASGKWLMDTDALTPLERSGWAQVDPHCQTMITYAASDVLDTAPLPRLLPPVDRAILDRERAMQRICARVSHRGVRLDPDHVHAKLDEHRTAKAELMAQIQGTYGIDNPGSPQQVAPVFAALGVELPRTKPTPRHPDGQPTTEKAALLPIQRAGGEASELARIMLDFRGHATVLNLLLEPFGLQVDHGDGRVRPTVYTLGADTGRTSCVRPNLQQLSREGGVRACITADPGMVIISADFQAVELRTAAALAGDAALYELIREGDARRARQLAAKAAGDPEQAEYWKHEAEQFDLHWRIAKQVWGPEAGKGDRYNAKRGVFGRLYGSGIKGIARTLGITEGEAQAVADTLDAMAPGVAAWSRGMQQFVRSGGTSMQAYSGRTIWLDRKFEHKAGNYAIQGTAKEFLTDGLLAWEQTPWGDCVLWPVHDEVDVVVPEQDAEAATAALVAAMSTQLNGMPIIAEPSEPSFAWADAS
jgi:DNA polymerase I-like protein with 3'-5' exonuclease and polymerase domains